MDMSVKIGGQPETIRRVTKIYSHLLIAGFALSPAILIAYLYFFQDPGLKFEDHLFHEIAISAATLEGVFITYVSWRCYLSSGEPLLRWLILTDNCISELPSELGNRPHLQKLQPAIVTWLAKAEIAR